MLCGLFEFMHPDAWGSTSRYHLLALLALWERFIGTQLALFLSPPIQGCYLKTSRRIFRSARLENYLLQDPAEGVKTAKNQAALERRPFSIDDLRAGMAVAGPES